MLTVTFCNLTSTYFSSLQENQKDLEQSTEKLSEFLEREISAENLVDIKQKVQDKYRLVERTTLAKQT